MSNKVTRRANGFRDTLIWLSPDAVAALEQLRRLHPGTSASVIVSNLLVASASTSSGHVAQTAAGGSISGSILGSIPGDAGADGGPGVAQLVADVADLRAQLEAGLAEVRAQMTGLDDSQLSMMYDHAHLADRMDLLESRLDKVAGPAPASAAAPVPAPATGLPATRTATKSKKIRPSYPPEPLIAALVEAKVRDGEGFRYSEVHRALVDAGVSVHPTSSNFWNFYKAKQGVIDAMVAERLAAGAAGGGAR